DQADGVADAVCQTLGIGGNRVHAVVGQNHASTLQMTQALVKTVGDNGLKRVKLKLTGFGCKGDGHIITKDFKGNLTDGFWDNGIDFAGHDGRARLARRQIDLTNACTWTT